MRDSPEDPLSPVRIGDLDEGSEFPFLTRLFGDLARVFLEVAIVLGEPFLGMKDKLLRFCKGPDRTDAPIHTGNLTSLHSLRCQVPTLYRYSVPSSVIFRTAGM